MSYKCHQGEIVRFWSAVQPVQTEPVPCSAASNEVATKEILRSFPLIFVRLPDGGCCCCCCCAACLLKSNPNNVPSLTLANGVCEVVMTSAWVDTPISVCYNRMNQNWASVTSLKGFSILYSMASPILCHLAFPSFTISSERTLDFSGRDLGFTHFSACLHRVAGHPLAQNERCLHMFLQDKVLDKNYTPSKIRQAWT